MAVGIRGVQTALTAWALAWWCDGVPGYVMESLGVWWGPWVCSGVPGCVMGALGVWWGPWVCDGVPGCVMGVSGCWTISLWPSLWERLLSCPRALLRYHWIGWSAGQGFVCMTLTCSSGASSRERRHRVVHKVIRSKMCVTVKLQSEPKQGSCCHLHTPSCGRGRENQKNKSEGICGLIIKTV